MRYSGIGYLDETGSFQLHRNILESLSVFDDAILFGIYYPTSKESADNKDEEIFHPDFMFTPIPYDLWPKTARLIIRVKKQAEAIRRISSLLKKYHITILNSVSNRSAHRYSTWDIHIGFEDLQMEGPEVQRIYQNDKWEDTNAEQKQAFGFKKDSNEYSITANKLGEIVNLINNLDKDVIEEKDKLLFNDKNEKMIEKAVVPRVNTALHYFYYNAESKKKERKDKRESGKAGKQDGVSNTTSDDAGIQNEMYDFIFRPFSVRYIKGNLILQDDLTSDLHRIVPNSSGKINNILYLSVKHKMDLYNAPSVYNYDYRNLLPTITFVESDSHFLGIRIVIIPSNKMRNFVKLNVYYQRQNNPYSSRGLLEYVSSKLPTYYKIWKYHNRLFECRPTYGNGKLTFYLEDERTEANYDMESYLHELEWAINDLNSKLVEEGQEHLYDFQLRGKAYGIKDVLAKHFKVNNTAKKENVKDVFISFSSDDIQEATYIEKILREHGVTCYLSSKELNGGDHFSENIRQALINSREVCLLYSPRSMRNSWVTTEWGAAWALQKRITPILLDISAESIPPDHERLKNLQFHKFRQGELESYAELVYRRRFIRL